MRIGLETNFRDYYDHWLDVEPVDYVLKRSSEGGLLKREQFQLMKEVGFQSPLHGLVKEVAPITNHQYLVVYHDETKHQGEGKTLDYRTNALNNDPDCYCSVYISTMPDYGIRQVASRSMRLLVVGELLWWLEYQSVGDWRSNCGEVNINILSQSTRLRYESEQGKNFQLLRNYPLFAIDFVIDHNQLLAIDFNSAPGIKGTGIEQITPGREIVNSLRNYVEELLAPSGSE